MGRKKRIDCETELIDVEKFPPVLYGLKGIMRLFHVSKATASRYKNTILKDCVAQKGNIIIVDVLACLKVFGVHSPENFLKNKTEPPVSSHD